MRSDLRGRGVAVWWVTGSSPHVVSTGEDTKTWHNKSAQCGAHLSDEHPSDLFRKFMGRLFLHYLESPSNKGVYACKKCALLGDTVHLARMDDILSKSFHSRSGPAYLFHQCVNITAGPPEEREMTTGRHTVCDIHCTSCNQIVGWVYVKAQEPRERYKEQKFILERAKVLGLDSQLPISPITSASISSGSDVEDPFEMV